MSLTFTNHLICTPEVCAAMGMTETQLCALSLSQFRLLAYSKGFDVRVAGFDVPSKSGRGKLTVKMDDDKRPIVHVSTPRGE